MIINSGATYTTASGKVVDYSHEIKLTDLHRHKYLSAMAEYLSYCDGEDEWTGSVEWDVYVQRFGKRILFNDDRGFVWVDKFASEDEAKAQFMLIAEAYHPWAMADDA